METTTFLLVLLAALLHASWNALVKTTNDRLLTIASIHLIAAMAGIGLIFNTSPPNSASYPYIALSTVIHWGYYIFLAGAYRVGDLSQVYPIARGCAPLLVAGAGILLAKEYLTGFALGGISLACFGIVLLSCEKGLPWKENRKLLIFGFATGLSIALYTVVDGLGVRQSGEPLAYIGWLLMIEGLTFSSFIYLLRRQELFQHWKLGWSRLVFGGLTSAGAYGIVVYVMNANPMAIVSALREVSVILAAIIGTLVLKESFGKFRLVAAFIITTGIVIMNLST